MNNNWKTNKQTKHTNKKNHTNKKTPNHHTKKIGDLDFFLICWSGNFLCDHRKSYGSQHTSRAKKGTGWSAFLPGADFTVASATWGWLSLPRNTSQLFHGHKNPTLSYLTSQNTKLNLSQSQAIMPATSEHNHCMSLILVLSWVATNGL